MQPGAPHDLPNPFALHLKGSAKRDAGQPGSGHHAFRTALKFFSIVAILFGITLTLGSYSKQWIVAHWMRDFESLPTAEKQQRLLQISGLGLPGIDSLVQALADHDPDVARTAYELLLQSQNAWTSLDWNTARKHHHTMVQSLQTIAASLAEPRTGWGCGLLQQTIMECVQKSDPESRTLYELATTTLSSMSLSDGVRASVIDDAPLDPQQPIRLAVRTQPLPVSEAQTDNVWTGWPAAEPAILSSGGPPQSDAPPDTSAIGEASATQSQASVYRPSASALTPVDPNESIVLNDVHDAAGRSRTASANAAHAPTSVAPSLAPATASPDVVTTSYLTQSPLETYTTESVIDWLGSEQANLRARAKDELQRRGFSQRQLEIATLIAAADVGSRIELVDSISRSDIDDPRPWLTLLLDDESREVRLRTISVIATMNDAAMTQKLRQRLVDERDPIVNAKIRRVLKLR
ncbi:MAG: hypothetical protein ACF788_13395 [Novipirellula sp. JB048]